MRALTEDGRVIDLGHRYLIIEGENGDEDTIRFENVKATVFDGVLTAHGCILTSESGSNLVDNTLVWRDEKDSA